MTEATAPMTAAPAIDNVWLDVTFKDNVRRFEWRVCPVRNVKDEYGTNRSFEMLEKPTSKRWSRGMVSIKFHLNVARGDHSGASIWYDPKELTAEQAKARLKELVAGKLQEQILAQEQQLAQLLSLE